MVSNIGTSVAYWNADSFSADHYAQCKIANAYGGPCVRWSGTSGYLASVGAAGGAIYRVDSGAFTKLADAGTPSAGATAKLAAVGSSISLYYDGVLDTTTSDSNYATGSAGINAFAGTSGQMDDFVADNVGGGGGSSAFPHYYYQRLRTA